MRRGQTLESAFPDVMPSVMDWLLRSGWRDPALLEVASLHHPEVLALHEGTLLQRSLEGSSGFALPRTRL
jgi:hypothetical protein